ncbi:MAG: hypothetical protein E7632_00835 [Ruminococcaceae bacterium]|nr:hypothetical protein [Oscillospiraceae bacterium]
MNTIKVNHGTTKMVAHRGVSGLERENTNAAFVAAGSRSYWGIETDVYRTADGGFVLCHDNNTKRVSGDNITIEESTLENLQRIRLFDKDGTKNRYDLYIPQLREYVSICKRYEKVGVLELKSAFTDEEIAAIIDIIKEQDYLCGITFISFSYENLRKVKAILPDQPCQFLCSECSDERIEQLKADKMDLDIHLKGVTEELVKKLHENGIEINVWTVDNPEDADRLIGWGVDYITSNILE